MILPKATLFPSQLLPLYIFEPRYRQMLARALDTHRMFAVAMRRTDAGREVPCAVAGLGLIRVSVRHRDGTSHLILQGLTRVELQATVQDSPYRIYRVRHLSTPAWEDARVRALIAQIRELLAQRTKLGLPVPWPVISGGKQEISATPPSVLSKEIVGYLDGIADPEQAVDLVSSAVLAGSAERQTILETPDLETRLRHLSAFLLAEIRNQRKRVIHE